MRRYPTDLVFCSRSGSPARPVAGARRQRPPRGAARDRRPGGRAGADRVRLRPHGGRLRPRHRGRWPPPSGSGSPSRGRHGRDRPAVRGHGARPAAGAGRGRSAARTWRGPQRRAIGPLWDACPVGLLPQPARRPPGAVRGRRRDAWPTSCSTLALRHRPRGRRAGRAGAARGRDRGRDEVQRRRRGHRGRPGREELIRPRLLAARPDDAFVGEEGDDEPGTSGIRWVVDPIDGTVNFLYGIPQYAVSIAAERRAARWSPAVVLNVATGTEYTADPSAVRRVPRRRTDRVRAPAPLDERLVLTGFAYDAAPARVQAAAVGRLLPQVRDIRRLGSCALDLCHVAEGQLDGYVEEGVYRLGPRGRGPGRAAGRAPASSHRPAPGADGGRVAARRRVRRIQAWIGRRGFLANRPLTRNSRPHLMFMRRASTAVWTFPGRWCTISPPTARSCRTRG